jgi:hypothetical protein
MTQLKVSQIELDYAIQPRAQLNMIVIGEYAEAMRSGANFPPVTVFLDAKGHYWLADGFHRIEAARMNGDGLAAVEADVHQGDRRDAILHACGANAEHGLRRTNADKRRAVETLLKDDEWGVWSNAEIARRCAVDEKTVRNLRAELFPGLSEPAAESSAGQDASSENPKIDTPPQRAPSVKGQDMVTARATAQRAEQTRTVQRNGKSYKMRTAKIGKQKPAKKTPVATAHKATTRAQIAGKAVSVAVPAQVSAVCPGCKVEPSAYKKMSYGWVCGDCGENVTLSVMPATSPDSTCPTCGKPVAAGTAFCGNCGAILKKGK